jgi:biopolymer transport protein ExbD
MAALTIDDDLPIGEVNTTPLIDVMLVLLIMFIITIPSQSHSVELDLPISSAEILVRDRNKLVVTAHGSLLWNGQQVSLEQLNGLLARAASMPIEPELQFEPEPEARYELVDQVLAAAKRANVGVLGFVGNERYARF